MCEGCYEALGSPKVINDGVLRAIRAVEAVYEVDFVGGSLHCVLDDFNLSDRDLDHCKGEIDKLAPGYYHHVMSECLAALKPLSVNERAAALALQGGFYYPDPTIGLESVMSESDTSHEWGRGMSIIDAIARFSCDLEAMNLKPPVAIVLDLECGASMLRDAQRRGLIDDASIPPSSTDNQMMMAKMNGITVIWPKQKESS